MNIKIGLLILVASVMCCSCQEKTNEAKAVRQPVSVKTHQYEKSEEASKDTLAQKDEKKKDSISVTPIEHASLVMKLGGKTIYVDPIADISAYNEVSKPDMILLTHSHLDHFKPDLLLQLAQEKTEIVSPKAVQEKIPAYLQNQTHVLDNNQDTTIYGIDISAIPMYNMREESKKFHPKGWGNGYVIQHKDKRVYISGDTEDIPEMRALKNIDVAFISMNLPYTMSVDQAVDAVLDFQPKKVYPYHYEETNAADNIKRLKKEVEERGSDIEVELLNWYPHENQKE